MSGEKTDFPLSGECAISGTQTIQSDMSFKTMISNLDDMTGQNFSKLGLYIGVHESGSKTDLKACLETIPEELLKENAQGTISEPRLKDWGTIKALMAELTSLKRTTTKQIAHLTKVFMNRFQLSAEEIADIVEIAEMDNTDAVSVKLAQSKLEALLIGLRAELVETQAMCSKASEQSKVFGGAIFEKVRASVKDELDERIKDELHKLLPDCMQIIMTEMLPGIVEFAVDVIRNHSEFIGLKKQSQELQAETNILKSQVNQLTRIMDLERSEKKLNDAMQNMKLESPTNSLTESVELKKRDATLADNTSLQKLAELTEELRNKVPQEFQDKSVANACQSGRVMQRRSSSGAKSETGHIGAALQPVSSKMGTRPVPAFRAVTTSLSTMAPPIPAQSTSTPSLAQASGPSATNTAQPTLCPSPAQHSSSSSLGTPGRRQQHSARSQTPRDNNVREENCSRAAAMAETIAPQPIPLGVQPNHPQFASELLAQFATQERHFAQASLSNIRRPSYDSSMNVQSGPASMTTPRATRTSMNGPLSLV
jgi:hypothetical protein